MTVCTNIH